MEGGGGGSNPKKTLWVFLSSLGVDCNAPKILILKFLVTPVKQTIVVHIAVCSFAAVEHNYCILGKSDYPFPHGNNNNNNNNNNDNNNNNNLYLFSALGKYRIEKTGINQA